MKILQIKQWSLSGQIQIDLFFEDVLDFEMSPAGPGGSLRLKSDLDKDHVPSRQTSVPS